MASGLNAARQTLVLHAGFEQANVTHIRLAHSPIGKLIEQCPCRIGEAPLPDRARTHRGLPPGEVTPKKIQSTFWELRNELITTREFWEEMKKRKAKKS